MGKRAISVICFVSMAVLFISQPTNLFAFRASEDILDAGSNSSAMTTAAGSSSELEFGLETIHRRNINQAVAEDAILGAKNFAEKLMNARLKKGASTASGFKAQLRAATADELGFRHIRLSQFFKGLPVVAAEIVVHLDKQNIIKHVNGMYLPSFNGSIQPAVSTEAALQVGLAELEGKPGLQVVQKPSLAILDSHLVYTYEISHGGDQPGQWLYYVDAQSGSVFFRFNNIKTAATPSLTASYAQISGNRLVDEDGSVVTIDSMKITDGNYFMANTGERWIIYDEDARKYEQQAGPDWGANDRAAVSAAKNFSLTQVWVKNVLGRSSFDNKNAIARGNIHTGSNYVNAYWDGQDFHFGDGDNSESAPLCSLDIVAHEYGHAITDYTSKLAYYFQSGALNESYSDIMGTAVEFASQSDGRASYPTGDPGYSDWLCGEDAWLSEEALRDLRDPKRFFQPSYYKGTYWYTGFSDNGGVHTNSGVQNFAYYLLAEGGSGTNDGHAYSVTGIGIAEAAKVAMRANMVYLTSGSKYTNARQAWIDAAEDLGYSVDSVMAAWTAVGVQ